MPQRADKRGQRERDVGEIVHHRKLERVPGPETRVPHVVEITAYRPRQPAECNRSQRQVSGDVPPIPSKPRAHWQDETQWQTGRRGSGSAPFLSAETCVCARSASKGTRPVCRSWRRDSQRRIPIPTSEGLTPTTPADPCGEPPRHLRDRPPIEGSVPRGNRGLHPPTWSRVDRTCRLPGRIGVGSTSCCWKSERNRPAAAALEPPEPSALEPAALDPPDRRRPPGGHRSPDRQRQRASR